MFSFEEAIGLVKKGIPMMRKSWFMYLELRKAYPDSEYIVLTNEYNTVTYEPDTDDMFANDWQYAIVCTRVDWHQYENTITKELDQYLLQAYKDAMQYVGGTYFNGYPEKGGMGIRVPGATRGEILIDKDKLITRIYLYNETESDKRIRCYIDDIYDKTDIFSKYIGCRLFFREEDLNEK